MTHSKQYNLVMDLYDRAIKIGYELAIAHDSIDRDSQENENKRKLYGALMFAIYEIETNLLTRKEKVMLNQSRSFRGKINVLWEKLYKKHKAA